MPQCHLRESFRVPKQKIMFGNEVKATFRIVMTSRVQFGDCKQVSNRKRWGKKNETVILIPSQSEGHEYILQD